MRLVDELARARTAADSRRAEARHQPLRCAHELGQLRDDLVQVADDAEVAELEDRRVRVLVDRDDRARSPACRPCAGSRPRCRRRRRASARRSCRSGRPAVEYGYQPASTTARVSRRLRRRAPSRAPRRARSSPGRRDRAPPATITSASSIDGPSDSSCACSIIVAASRSPRTTARTPRPRPRRRSRRRRTRPGGRARARGSRRPADVGVDASPASAGRLPTSDAVLRREVDEIPVQACVEPRAARPPAMSAASTDAAKSTVSMPCRGRAARARRPAAAAAAPRAPASSAT